MFTPTRRAHPKPSCLLICILVAVKTVETSSDFCNVTRSTKKVVPDCPDSVDKWKEASKKKTCTQYASQCSEPEKLEYHCVINPFINETLEVCAYGQNIILGHCAEYSSSGNLIQSNLNTNCMDFSSKPCPIAYKSTEAYKYPGCYDLTKKTTVTEQTATKSDPKLFDKIGNEENADRYPGVLTITLLTLILLLLLTSGLLTLLVRHLKKKTYHSRSYRYGIKDFKKNSNEVVTFINEENETGNV